MKKITTLIISCFILLSLPLTAFAYDYSGGGRTALVYDLAELISQEDESTLNYKLEQLSDTYACEVALLTVNSTNGKDITAFADDYYDYNGFGYGVNDDGIMLVVDMGEREFAITTYGTATDIFTDYNLTQIENAFVGELSSGNYTNAFIAYYEKCESIFIDYEYYENNYDGGYVYIPDDDGYDGYYNDNSSESQSPASEIFSLKWIAISVVIGIVVALIYTSVLKSQLKTVKSKPSAADYVVPGSVQITQQRDVFMYRDVKKVPKPKNNSSSSGRSGGSSFGGGSSTHSSSSGRSHGGSRGSF